jgi:hypothetical protein
MQTSTLKSKESEEQATISDPSPPISHNNNNPSNNSNNHLKHFPQIIIILKDHRPEKSLRDCPLRVTITDLRA